ncbi:MAG: hypothetical protein ACTHLZ_19285, partial [Tepidisphaeraceae bacterium]
MRLTLSDFAATLDQTAATSSKLAKQQRLAELFRTLHADDLRLAVRYTAGRPFPATDERVIGVSGRIVSDVVLELLSIDADAFRSAAIRRGELGEAVGEVWPAAPEGAEPVLTLEDIHQAFERLAGTTQPGVKRGIVRDLFARCVHPREACYLAKILVSDLRTGVQEGVLQAAVAVAFEVTLAEVLR